MAYWIPGRIQKKLLKYALSRLELVDTDALDLDNLEIAWGKRSTIELNDVGLRKAKLSSILRLPDSLSIEKARVRHLKITVPADLHLSSIVVAIEGVEAGLRLHDDSKQHRPAKPKQASERTRHKQGIYTAEVLSSDEELESLPTPRDLVKSFLAEESHDERKHLEAALKQSTGDLERSVASSESSDEIPMLGLDLGVGEGAGTGFGNGIGLPGFLAAFLKGVSDRLKVRIHDVVVTLDAHLDLPSEDGFRLPNSRSNCETTLSISIDTLDLFEANMDEIKPTTSGETGSIERRITLAGITAALISDPAIFEQLSNVLERPDDHTMSPKKSSTSSQSYYSPAVSRPASDWGRLNIERTASPAVFRTINHPTPRRVSISSSACLNQSFTNNAGVEHTASPVRERTFHSRPPCNQSVSSSGSLHQSFASDAGVDIVGLRDLDLLGSAGDLQRSHGRRVISSLTSQIWSTEPEAEEDVTGASEIRPITIHDTLGSFRSERVLASHGQTSERLPRRFYAPSERQESPRQRSRSPSMEIPGMFRTSASFSHYLQTDSHLSAFPDSAQEEEIPGTKPTADNPYDDLAESKFFSHDEAQSIYESAVFDTSGTSPQAGKIPAAWNDHDLPSQTTPPDASPRISPESLSHVSQPELPSDLPTSNSFSPDRTDRSEKVPPQPSSSFCGPNAVIKQVAMVSSLQLDITPSSEPEDTDSLATSSASLSNFNLTSSQPSIRPMPGAFSLYAEANASIIRSRSIKPVTPLPKSAPPENFPKKKFETSMTLAVKLGEVKAQVDMAVARLMIQLYHKLTVVLHADVGSAADDSTKKHPKMGNGKSSKQTNLNFWIQDLRFSFVEVIHGVLYQTFRTAATDNKAWLEDVLFTLKSSEVSAKFPGLESLTSLKLDIGTLGFGFHDASIVSFGAQRPIKSAMKNPQVLQDKAITIKVNSLNEIPEIFIETAPVEIILDVHRIDSTLGSIGGLSGLLEIGSSIASETTVTSRASPPRTNSPRMVRFDTSAKSEVTSNPRKESKINIRVGGTLVILQGHICSMKLHSTSVKVAARTRAIGVTIGEMHVKGPFLLNTPTDMLPLIRVVNIRLDYLFVPEEADLTRLISLLTPSKDKFEDDDDLLLDTLVKQRKKGAVLRVNVEKTQFVCETLDNIDALSILGQELTKLSAVTRYLPEETRPGLMILARLGCTSVNMNTGMELGEITLDFEHIDIAHVSAPVLIALTVGKIFVTKDLSLRLVTAAVPLAATGQYPMVMARMIEDELEPAVKIKLWNTCIEYDVLLMKAFLDAKADETQEELAMDMATSFADLLRQKSESDGASSPLATRSQRSATDPKPFKVQLAIRDCAVGLNPLDLNSKAIFMLNDANFSTGVPNEVGVRVTLELRKAQLLLIDDVSKLNKSTTAEGRNRALAAATPLAADLCKQGFVSVCTMSATVANIAIRWAKLKGEPDLVNFDFKNELFVLETCADSTQTLIETLNALKPPMPPSKGQKYRTEVGDLQDMLASFTGEPIQSTSSTDDQGEGDTEELFAYNEDDEYGFDSEGDDTDSFEENSFEETSDTVQDDEGSAYGAQTYGKSSLKESVMVESNLGASTMKEMDPLTAMTPEEAATAPRQEHVLGSIHLGQLPMVPQYQGVAKRWDSMRNKYIPVTRRNVSKTPLQIHVEDMHAIWNLFDGYDWESTRTTISKAVQDVEARAEEKRHSRRARLEDDDEKESIVGDLLFNSIYISIPANHDPRELSRQINRDIDDLTSETASHTVSQAPSFASSSTAMPSASHRVPGEPKRKLRLDRSKRHKISFEVSGLSADMFIYPTGGETVSSTDVRIMNFEIFDLIPTSTWKKFMTYDHDHGTRERNRAMIHIEICDVKPVLDLTATELVIKVSVLPVRLHVDQDALDFITRFFEFNDGSKTAEDGSIPEEPFLQRVEVLPVPVKLDYKPKKVDYAGLRSGRTKEFMNFFILDGAQFILRHVILYGCSGLTRMHHTLQDIWTPDVTNNQLPTVLSGLNGVRTLVNLGTGVRNLIQIPMNEYRKDGRLVRSIPKGVLSFARISGVELTKLGARLAIGAQTALQGAEGLIGGQQYSRDEDHDPEERRLISYYANQPTNFLQGLKGAARSLERDLLVAKDVIIAISGEVRESGSAGDALGAITRNSAFVVTRPMIGFSKAIGQIAMGATNSIDPENKRRVDDKYKH